MISKKTLLVVLISTTLFITSCKKNENSSETKEVKIVETLESAPVYNTEDPKTIMASIAHAHGTWNDLWSKKDVQYTYDYRTADGKADISTERYIFDTEASFGHYTRHEVNAMPGEKGNVVQYYDGKSAMVSLGDKVLKDPVAIGGSDFLRRANHFWFVMPYKLGDKGTILKYLGQESYNNTNYDKIEVTYDPVITGKEQNDIYILYVNPSTKMIDRFYFSLPALGVNAPVIIANYNYEDIDGQKVATKRTYFLPNEKGEYGETPTIVQTLSNIKFNNGFTKDNIMIMN